MRDLGSESPVFTAHQLDVLAVPLLREEIEYEVLARAEPASERRTAEIAEAIHFTAIAFYFSVNFQPCVSDAGPLDFKNLHVSSLSIDTKLERIARGLVQLLR